MKNSTRFFISDCESEGDVLQSKQNGGGSNMIIVSQEAAIAIQNAIGAERDFYAVRISNVRPALGEEEFPEESRALLFDLTNLQTEPPGGDDYVVRFDRLSVFLAKGYGPFLTGGRVLHCDRRVDFKLTSDGSGFVLWPLQRYNAFRDYIKEDKI